MANTDWTSLISRPSGTTAERTGLSGLPKDQISWEMTLPWLECMEPKGSKCWQLGVPCDSWEVVEYSREGAPWKGIRPRGTNLEVLIVVWWVGSWEKGGCDRLRWLSTLGSFPFCSPLCCDTAKGTLNKGWMLGAGQSGTYSLPSCELCKYFFFLRHLSSGISSQQHKTD